ncbi:MAG TPA: type I methionyl aminopeptidase [Patescibacteria group bacterium]|nr:type I methionyl aminopeptidase [Patescibacteria group bacterium]
MSPKTIAAGRRGPVKTEEEIALIAEGGKLLHGILLQAAALVKPGVSTAALNDFAEQAITDIGGRPSFKGYGPKHNPYPAGLCTSVNDEVVHGIPSGRTLKDGDIIGLDIGMEYRGLYTDHAITVGVGRVSDIAGRLMDATQKSLAAALKIVRPGARIGDIGWTIQSTAEAAGFSVVRDLVGHGVGYAVHEDPSVPCYGKRGTGALLREGMVLAIEPMLCQHDYYLTVDNDGWTIRTADGGLSAHFEHTVAVTKHGVRILTA